MPESTLGQLSTLLVYGAMAAYMVALVSFAVDLSGLRDRGPQGRRRRAAGIAMATTWLGAALHLIAVVTRGIAAGRVPWANMYEFSLLATFMAVALFLGLQRGRDLRFLGTFITGPVLLLLGVAVAVLYVRADGVPPALDSYWLVIHVSVATLATGVFTVAVTFSVIQLFQERAELHRSRESLDPPRPSQGAERAVATVVAEQTEAAPRLGVWGRLLESVPSSAELERLAFRLNAVGFMMWTFTVIAGAIWAEHAWGRPWGWDPKEVWSFVIWVVYAAYLHARATRGWEGRRAAYLSIFGFVCILANYFVVNLLFNNSLHAYSGLG
ncbi:c-type cytochrome biogenesis protein CcsB [Georgenia yuyongxinii]|uniref:C-type cytochrome biogenesis protein CcsB n=1 Tax=Georgenia yuyongxinii TaxID=2589797 RepID=A0A5B8C6E5_9MICO|nr:c-type cytochrome biogenesis protein CcsB [Georgenia yuyongxinii]QDC25968.1 c-type cytochrome biogenesis protein CcsB [Georgenia yuyongxinii]